MLVVFVISANPSHDNVIVNSVMPGLSETSTITPTTPCLSAIDGYWFDHDPLSAPDHEYDENTLDPGGAEAVI